MIIGLDHVAILVRDLEAATANYAALMGRAPDWRGDVTGGRHAWFQLANTAVDIIAPEGTNDAAKGLEAYLASHGEGLFGVAFAVRDLDAAHRTLERRGVAMSEIEITESRDAKRGLTRQWRIATARRKSSNGFLHIFVEATADRARDAGGVDIAGLDHIVVHTANPDRALALYGAKLSLDLRLDRTNEKWGSRLLFFRCGDLVVEIGTRLGAPVTDAPDGFGGLAWRVRDADGANARLLKAGFAVSEVRSGRKQGTKVFTVKDRTGGVPTLMIQTPAQDRRDTAAIS